MTVRGWHGLRRARVAFTLTLVIGAPPTVSVARAQDVGTAVPLEAEGADRAVEPDPLAAPEAPARSVLPTSSAPASAGSGSLRISEPPAVAAGAAAESETALAPPAPTPFRPYSIPWNLRPLPAVNLVRLDHSLGLHDAYGPTSSGLAGTFTQLVTLGVRVADAVMLIARWGWDWTSRPDSASASTILLGANITTRLESVYRLSVFVAATVPNFETNGRPSHRDARLARASMDNAMFLPGHAAAVAGVGFAWIDQGWTVQAEATLFALGRVTAASDDAIVNATFGAHVGYFVVPQLSVSGELHHQHFLSDPVVLRRAMDYGEELRSQTSGTLGVRAHWNVAGSLWIRPGLAWTIGFDAPMAADSWQVIQLDVPILF